MGLILRQNTGNDPLTYEQLDGNFEYFTGSHAITGSLVVSGDITGTLLGTASVSDVSNYVDSNNVGGPYGMGSIATASYAVDSNNAQTASYVEPLNQDVTISGSINFVDGSTIQSTGSTLELTPDASIPSDQYIVLDPTAPNHIHVRAGGTIDESNADLYLGGEKTNILVTDPNQQVQINTTAADSSSLIWIFDNEGNTLFPTLTTPRGDTNSGDLITQTLRLGNGTDQAVVSTPNGTDAYPNSQRLVINPGQGSGSYEGGDLYLWAGRGGVDGGTGGDIKVRGGYGPESGSGGYVRIEGGDTDHGTAGFVEIKGGNSTTENGGDVYIYGGQGNTNAQNGDVTITTYDNVGAAKNWNFDVNGTLTAPGNITADSFTGSLEGTASYAENAATSSYYSGATIDASVYISQVNPDQACSLLFTTLNSSDYSYPSFDTTPTLTYNPNGATGILSLTGSMLINALGSKIIMSNLPTTEPSTPGELWLSGSTDSSKFLCVKS